MARKRYMKERWTMGKVLFTGIVLIAVGAFIFMGPAQTLWTQYAPEAWREKPEGVTDESMQVDLSIKCLHSLDRGNPAATPIRVYDANKNFIESSSTSSGIATFAAPYWEGETIYLQARAAAPVSSTYVTYTTPMMEYVVPDGDVNGDAELPLLMLDETSTSEATITGRDQDGALVATEAGEDHVNTTDTDLYFVITVTADCVYGTPADFTDYDTGKHYLGGAWLVIFATASQGISNYDHAFSTPDYYFYVFRLPMIVHDSDLGYTTSHEFHVRSASGFTASADFDIDVYDTVWADSLAAINSNSFLDGDSDLTPDVITSAVE